MACAAQHRAAPSNGANLFWSSPLDSITAKELKKASNYRELARWPGVSGLKPETSASYQAVAERVAKRRGIARVHLDVYWWGGARGAV
jgi:hypothetical protein